MSIQEGDILVIEYPNSGDDGNQTEWGISFEAWNPDAAHFVRTYNKDEAFKLRDLVKGIFTSISPSPVK